MAGYLNRFIDLPFPDLAGVDDNGRAVVWVKIRNPRLMAAGELTGTMSKVRLDEQGRPVDTSAATEEGYGMFARLVLAGHVWDATWIPPTLPNGDLDEDAEAPLVPMPPSPDDLAKMPIEILNRIGEEVKKATPR